MTPKQIAEVGVARLGLPIPMAKLMTIQAIGTALSNDLSRDIFVDSVVEWLEIQELESQCLEALCSLLIAKPDASVVERFRHAVARPSVASDMILSLSTAAPTLPRSWSGCHSGPVPKLLKLDAEERELRLGIFIPLLFTHELEALQERTGFPLLRQWSFEFRVLGEQYGTKEDGHLSYFCGQEHDNEGQFVARRGHLARSAYLRVLAYAVEKWNMPAHLARKYASIVFPSEPIFLKLAPQSPPSWAPFVQRRPATETADAQALVSSLLQRMQQEEQRQLMHCSLTVTDTPLCHAELEIFAVARAHDDLDPQSAINFHHYLIGKFTPSRDNLRAFVSPEIESDIAEELRFAPVVLPLVGTNLGYLQSDLVVRTPFVPISTKNVSKLELVPDLSGAVFRLGEKRVGVWSWWLWDWNPTHPQGWSTPIGCRTSLTPAVAEQMSDDLGGPIEHVWMLSTWTREKEYAEWHRDTQVGRVRPGNND